MKAIMRSRVAFGLLLSLLLALTGCDLERELEKLLGAISQTFVEMSYGTADDPLLTEVTEQVGRRVAEVSPRRDMPLKFRVLNTGDANALALPNGRIYVFRGMVEMTDTEDELAAVLAHEAGHVAGRHSLKQFRLSLGISLLADLLNLNKRGETLQAVAGLAAALYELGYNRQQEKDADNYGLRLALLAGYDPKGSVELFDKFYRREGKASRWTTYLSTHPPSEKRLERAKQANADLGSIQRDLPAFAAHTLIADGYAQRGLYRHATCHYEAALKQQANHVPALLGLAKAKEAWGEWDEACRWYEQVLQYEPNNEAAKQGIERVRQAPKEKPSSSFNDDPTHRLFTVAIEQALQDWQRLQTTMPDRWKATLTVTNRLTQQSRTMWEQLSAIPSPHRSVVTITIGKQRGERNGVLERWQGESRFAELTQRWDEAVNECTRALLALQMTVAELEGLQEEAWRTIALWHRSLEDWRSLAALNADRRGMQALVRDSERSATLVQRALVTSQQDSDDVRYMEQQLSRAMAALAEASRLLQRRTNGAFDWIAEMRLNDAKAFAKSAIAEGRVMLSRLAEKRAQVDKALLSAYHTRLEALEMRTPKDVTVQMVAYHVRTSPETVLAMRNATPDIGAAAIVLALAKARRLDPYEFVKSLDFKGDWMNQAIPSRVPSGAKVVLRWLTTAWERELDTEAKRESKSDTTEQK